MSNTFTSRDTLKTKLLAAVTAATTADQIVKLSRSIEKANLDDDADLESALDTKVSAMAGTATTADIEKLAFGVKKLRTPAAAASPTSTMVAEGSSNLYATPNRVRGSFSASGDLSYNSGTGVLSYTALPDALTVYATVADLPASGVAAGAKGIVEENKKLYIFTGASWVGVGLVDQKPSFTITPEGSYTLSPGVDTVIALAATDPQGDPITFSHVVSAGSLGGSTVVQSGNAFTITGSTDSVNDTAPFSITFRASDGTNITESSSEFTVQFVVPAKIVVGARYVDTDGNNSGAAYIYDPDGTNEVRITSSDIAANDHFGVSVAVGHNKIIVGAAYNDDNGDQTGSVYVYDFDGTNEVKITASDGGPSEYFGGSVAIGDNKIVVGATGADPVVDYTGAAYVYDLDGTNEVKITASDAAAWDMFGGSVAVGNNKIVVGATNDGDNGTVMENSGAAYIYDLDGSNEVKIKSSDHAKNDYFGKSVAIGDNKIVVSAHEKNIRAGAVYVYDLDGTNEVKITASDGTSNDYFGEVVAVGDNKIVVGVRRDDVIGTNSGSVYVYDLDGTNEVKITASDAAQMDHFGASVSVGNNKIIVGSIDDMGSRGSVYVYDLDGTNEVKITASDAASDDKFGSAVAIG